MKFSMGNMLARMELGLNPNSPVVNFTPARITEACSHAMSLVLEKRKNFFSAFEAEGPDGLQATMLAYVSRKGLLARAQDALEVGDETAFVATVMDTVEAALVELYDRGALQRIQLFDEGLPAEAFRDYLQMSARVIVSRPAEVVAAATEEATPEVVETPTEVCAREYRELGSDAFARKYLRHTGNRTIYEQALAEGKI